MKRKFTVFTWMLSLILMVSIAPVNADVGGSLPDAGNDPWQIVVNDIAGQVVALLPEDVHLWTLSIGTIEGDDGSLAEALSAAITSATSIQLVTDDALRSEENSGVEGILQGRVINKTHSPFYSSIEVFLKLEDVQSHTVVFARTFQASYLPKLTRNCLMLAALALLVWLVLSSLKRRRIAAIQEYCRKDPAIQQQIETELKKTRDNLSRSHDLLITAEKKDLAVKVRAQKEELGRLLLKLEQGPAVHPDAINKAMVSELKTQNKWMKGLVKNVQVESEKLLTAAGKQDFSGVQRGLDGVADKLKNAANRSYHRVVGRS